MVKGKQQTKYTTALVCYKQILELVNNSGKICSVLQHIIIVCELAASDRRPGEQGPPLPPKKKSLVRNVMLLWHNMLSFSFSF